MHPAQPSPTNPEAELESFRQQWRDEVTARAKATAPATLSPTQPAPPPAKLRANPPDTAPCTPAACPHSVRHVDEGAPHGSQDVGGKQHGRRLDGTNAQTAAALEVKQEPQSALEHYEKAVEKETQGSLGDSVNLYRKAFKLDSKVHETYKAKHFPPSYFLAKGDSKASTSAPTPQVARSVAKSVPQHSYPSQHTTTGPSTAYSSPHGLSPAIQALVNDVATLSIPGLSSSPTDTPSCPISTVPEEILADILIHLAMEDFVSFVRLAQVCKRLAYLTTTEDRVWKHIVLGHDHGFAAMHYTWACEVDGEPLGNNEQGGFLLGAATLGLSDVDDTPSFTSLTQCLVPAVYPTYRILFQRRPRVRFNGCYISTVNYMRPGQSSPTSLTWNSPIHIVTYYRYLRFLRDGTCISLLTTSEPADVVPYLYVKHIHKNHGSLPTAPMKDALLGRWRLTGPDRLHAPEHAEKEGTLIVETEGVLPKYLNKMAFRVGNTGRGATNNKLMWQGYWSYNRLTDDWAEYGLKNDRAFYWSRVKSYGLSWDEGAFKPN